ncbi:contact-dependent growth inhibition system immunity protein [Nostoc sp.]|uniref:contact-dependent growth inhibition system immunity protein n=1 Tax=Nostoc sp. TaxID=1180 RepID=UPI002FF9DF2F
MALYKKRYPELTYFFGAYFHQDWTVMYDWQGNEATFEVVVCDFKNNNPKETVIQATQELEQLLKQNLTESSLRRIVTDKLGANVYAPGMGLTYQKWLEAVLTVLKGI